jgi:hypothetical protein
VLESKLPPISALDFTEQLMIFDECGMIYGRPEFVQANQVRLSRSGHIGPLPDSIY